MPTMTTLISLKRLLQGLAVLAVIQGMSGCAVPQSVQTLTNSTPDEDASLGNIEYHTHVLANELFANLIPRSNVRYAVTGFVPMDTMEYNVDDQHPLNMLGHQLEQGLITESSKRGFITQEFKLANDIIIGDDSDRVLSRNIDHLSGLERVDFYITGTLLYQQKGAVVNARVVNAETKDVVAAATKFFPANLFWREESVTTRNGLLYRTEIKR